MRRGCVNPAPAGWLPRHPKDLLSHRQAAGTLPRAQRRTTLLACPRLPRLPTPPRPVPAPAPSLATFYSRSRKERWCKGETSGHFIRVARVFADCDRDSIVYLGDPVGPACHTGAR